MDMSPVAPHVPGMLAENIVGGPGPMVDLVGCNIQQMQALLLYQQMLCQNLSMMPKCTLQSDNTPQPPIREVGRLVQHFRLDDRLKRDLDKQMRKRSATMDDDMRALWEILDGARNPAGLLRLKIREMEAGTFRGIATPDRDVEELAKKYKLDANASAKLAEVLAKREDRKRDLKMLGKHLELSNRPSALVMMMLKDLRSGVALRQPEYPAAVGSYAHRRGLRRARSRSRGRRRWRSSSRSRGRHKSRSLSWSPSRDRGSGCGASSDAPANGPRPQTLLERFG